MQNTNITSFKDIHIEQSIDLLIQSFSNYPWFENWSYEFAKARIHDMYFSNSFRGLAYIHEGEVVGFAIGNLEYWEQNVIYYLNELCVRSSYKNKYIGSELMQEIEKTLKRKKVDQIYLSTIEEGSPESFFRKQGYNTNKKRIVMEKNL